MAVIYTDLGGNSNSNLLIFNVIVIAIYYIDLGSNCNSNSNNYTDFEGNSNNNNYITLHCIVIDPMSGLSIPPHLLRMVCFTLIDCSNP